jgi:hypothetical protein
MGDAEKVQEAQAEVLEVREPPATLLTALLAVQAEIPTLKLGKDSEGQIAGNKNYRYMSLHVLMAEVLPLLNKHGLVWITKPEVGTGDGPTLEYALMLASVELGSEELIAGTFPLMIDKQNSQGLGSALTYARRYALTAVLGLVPDDDDDGAAASKTEKKPALKAAKEPSSPLISKERRIKLFAKIGESESPNEERALILAAVGAEDELSLTEAQGEHAWRLLNA